MAPLNPNFERNYWYKLVNMSERPTSFPTPNQNLSPNPNSPAPPITTPLTPPNSTAKSTPNTQPDLSMIYDTYKYIRILIRDLYVANQVLLHSILKAILWCTVLVVACCVCLSLGYREGFDDGVLRGRCEGLEEEEDGERRGGLEGIVDGGGSVVMGGSESGSGVERKDTESKRLKDGEKYRFRIADLVGRVLHDKFDLQKVGRKGEVLK